jgi:hypothetical protein
MMARQNQLTLIGEPSAQDEELLTLHRVPDYRDVRHIFVIHEGNKIPINVETAAEMMRRRICVHHYQEGENLFLTNTEPQFIRPARPSPAPTMEPGESPRFKK